MSTPRTVDLEITSRCNARCRYCYYLNNEGVAYQDITTGEWLNFFEELGWASVMSVCLLGGEPLVRPDILKLIDGIVCNRMRFQLLTNGSLVTRKIARHLHQTGRCDWVQVSLDGSRAETHEYMRGKGSFEPALNAIELLLEEGLHVTVRVTVHPGNIGDLPALAHLLLVEKDIPLFSTNAVSSLGSGGKYDGEIFLTAGQRFTAMKVLAKLDKRYPGRIEATAGPLAEWKMFNEMETARSREETIADRGRLVGCGCIFSRMAVRSDGTYVPCVMLPQMVLGVVGRDPLADTWRQSPELNTMRKRRLISLRTFNGCKSCEYSDLCTGNCPGNALSQTGSVNRPSREGCLKRFKKELAKEGIKPW